MVRSALESLDRFGRPKGWIVCALRWTEFMRYSIHVQDYVGKKVNTGLGKGIEWIKGSKDMKRIVWLSTKGKKKECLTLGIF
jgi:pyrimidine operon attenuation protein/uracil phosphoribosyltransferase